MTPVVATRPKVLVVGAGIGGLSAAISAAAAGCDVVVHERLARPGGKMGEVREAGYRWDTGPSIITMRPVLERLFESAGRRLDDYLELLPVTPLTRYFWPDGVRLDALTDIDAMCEQIRHFAPDQIDPYRRFMRYAERLHATVAGPFLYRDRPGLADLLRLPLHDTLKIDAMRSMHAAITAHFKDPHLIQLFDRFATYNGSSPYLAPATLNVIAHVEMAQGAWYPRGGVFALARALERLALDTGVTLHYSSPVTSIMLNGTTARGLRFEDGSDCAGDAIVINADYAYAQRALLPPAASDQRTARRLEPSCSALVLLLGVPGQRPELAHHNILFCRNYRDEFSALFTTLRPPADPTLYICITSKTDPDHAPAQSENWFVLTNAPHLSPKFDWQRDGPAYVQHVKTVLGTKTGTNLTDTPLDAEATITPLDIARMYGADRGSIYGFSSNSRLAAFLRPANRSSRAQRLYYVGGSAHPGGGVPLVALSGMAAAAHVCHDLGLGR